MTSESSPLLQTQSTPSTSKSARPPRTVTFNTVVSTSSHAKSSTSRPSQQLGPIPDTQFTSGSSQPVLSALNSKIRRRNSAGAPLTPQSIPGPKLGPQRTTRTAEKLKLLPNPEHEEDGVDQESGREVYSQFTRIKDPNARRDAARLGKEDRRKLPRVTAYCTASAYQMGDMMRFLRGRGKTKGANPKLFDECIYTPYNYGRSGAEKILDEEIQSQRRPSLNERPSLSGNGGRSYSDSALEIEGNNEQRRDDLIDLHTEAGDTTLDTGDDSMPNHNAEVLDSPRNTQPTSLDFDTEVHSPEVFLFNYGVVVIWGMTVQQEERFLKEIAKFETEKLGKDDVQTENFNFYYTREYQARIYNDFISLREKKNYMTKLAISHALAQSTKVR